MEHTATYSPEDNKLRLYPAYRLDKEDYYKFKKAGFKWAPKQELFVAPMWTPAREDILIEFCGEIEDEDKTLVDRAEERAERFEGYSEKREQDAHRAKKAVSAIADNIPLGQPILIGHHSEKRARKDAERIENGMRKAVKMWETSKYWKMRAAGAIAHAKYKEKPEVRARRIKKIEAQKRKQEKIIKESRGWLNIWLAPNILTKSRALYIANYCYSANLWSDLDQGKITAREARNRHVPVLESTIAHCERWIKHCENRLLYEKAMLESQGASDLLKPKSRPKQLPLLNYRAPDGLQVENMYNRGEFETYPQIEMTKKEYMSHWKDSRGTTVIENSHRVRVLYKVAGGQYSRNVVFLTDSKTHKKPEPKESKPIETPKAWDRPTTQYQPPKRTEFDDMKDTLREGVKTASAPQLFPTPKELARKMVELAGGVMSGRSILEPSAGTGNLIRAAVGNATGFDCCKVTAVEINQDLVETLKQLRQGSLYANEGNFRIIQDDFLECNGDLGQFDVVLMNPPFKNGEDIKHIKHATTFLKDGGILVALCANGPRQQDKLKPLADTWEDLPQGTFKDSGTMVNTALLSITK